MLLTTILTTIGYGIAGLLGAMLAEYVHGKYSDYRAVKRAIKLYMERAERTMQAYEVDSQRR